MFSGVLTRKAQQLIENCQRRNLKMVTAESCTGGLIAALITEIPGSSAVFERGFVTYANAAKEECLGVSASLLASYGAVSKEVASAMAQGALQKSGAQLATAVTGIAGPGGGTAEKPVGLVYIAVAFHDTVEVIQYHFKGDRRGDRSAIRLAATEAAIDMALKAVTENKIS